MLRQPFYTTGKNPLAARLFVVLSVLAVAVGISGVRAPVAAEDPPTDTDADELLFYPNPEAPKSSARRLSTEEQDAAPLHGIHGLKIRVNGKEIEIERFLDEAELRETLSMFMSDGERSLMEKQLGTTLTPEKRDGAPPTHRVTALFRVARRQPSLVGNSLPVDDREWEILCKTQVALIKSYFVLQDALRDPEINQLPLVRQQEDAVGWLDRNVLVFPPTHSEVLRIEMLCHDSEVDQCRKLVDAVADAYEDQVIFAARKKERNTRDVLAMNLVRLNGEKRRKMEDFQQLARELGSAEHTAESRVRQELAIRRLERIEDVLMELESELLQVELIQETRGDDERDEDVELNHRYLTERIEQLVHKREELAEEVAAREEGHVELKIRQQELERLIHITNELAVRIETMDLEMDAPPRITKIQPATASRIGD